MPRNVKIPLPKYLLKFFIVEKKLFPVEKDWHKFKNIVLQKSKNHFGTSSEPGKKVVSASAEIDY